MRSGCARTIIFLIFGLLLVHESEAATEGKKMPSFKANVVAVQNGHSLTVLLEKAPIEVRLWGVVSPKKGSHFAGQAKHLIEQVCLGKKVLVIPTSIESFGLVVARVRVDTYGWLHEILLSEGLVWLKEQEAPESKRLKILQEKARRNKKGIWSESDFRPPLIKSEHKLQSKKGRKRNGKNKIKESTSEPQGDPLSTVAITARGRNYHKVDCRKIKGTAYKIKLLRARESYSPCRVCKPPP